MWVIIKAALQYLQRTGDALYTDHVLAELRYGL